MRLKLELSRTRPLIRTTNTFFLFSYNGYVSLNTKPSISFHQYRHFCIYPLFDLLHLVHVLHDVDRLHQMSLQLRISSEEKEESSKHRFLASVSPVNREAVWCQAIHR